jgi:hypothetical protein
LIAVWREGAKRTEENALVFSTRLQCLTVREAVYEGSFSTRWAR